MSGASTPTVASGIGERETMATSVSFDDESTVSTQLPNAPPPTLADTIIEPGNAAASTSLLRHVSSSFSVADMASNKSEVSDNYVARPNSTKSEQFGEANIWEDNAKEQVALALKRLAVLAEDMNKKDPSKSVEHFYSQVLAEAIQQGEITFDKSFL